MSDFVLPDRYHYDDVKMSSMASQITSLTIIYSTVYSGTDQRKHQSSASLAFVWGIHRGPVNSPHKWPVTRKCFHLTTSSCKKVPTGLCHLINPFQPVNIGPSKTVCAPRFDPGFDPIFRAYDNFELWPLYSAICATMSNFQSCLS